MRKEIAIQYEEYVQQSELSEADRELLKMAKDCMKNAYAPYSKFKVGAALRLADGRIVCGSNQENAAFPSGLCAERVAVFAAGANYPDVPIDALAITASHLEKEVDHPISPCGACRQSLVEYEHKYGRKIKILLQGSSGHIIVFDGIESLLPFQFNSDELGV